MIARVCYSVLSNDICNLASFSLISRIMAEVVVWKLDSTQLELALCLGATVLDLQAAVSMRLGLPSIFIKLVSNRGECSDLTAPVVESNVGWYQVLVVVTPALNVLKDCDVDADAKVRVLSGFANLGPFVAKMDCINTIVNFDVNTDDPMRKYGLLEKARIAFLAVVQELESLSIEVGIHSWIFVDGVNFFRDLWSLKRLCTLEINFDQCVDGRFLWCFDSAWCHLARLTSLKLSFRASRIGFRWIMEFFGDLLAFERLCSLELNFYPRLDNVVFWYLGEGLRVLVHLTSVKLCLHDARVDGLDCVLHFIGQIGHLSNMRSLQLDLPKNSLGDQGAQLLGESIGKLVKLESLELDVQDNQIGDEGARCLGKGLRELTGLTTLRVFLLKNMIGVGELQKLCNLEGRVKSRKRPLPS